MTVPWTAEGSANCGRTHGAHDLINLPPEPELLGWLNIYPGDKPSAWWRNKVGADANATPDRLECRPIYRDPTYSPTKGEGG